MLGVNLCILAEPPSGAWRNNQARDRVVTQPFGA
jgi:hypothetical protein